MQTQIKDELESVMYSYTIDSHRLEQENKLLKETVKQLQNEIKRFKEPALMVCDIVEILEDRAIIKTPNGNRFYVNIALEVKGLLPGDSVLVEQKNLTVVEKIRNNRRFNVEKFVIIEKPRLQWGQVGGLAKQINEIREVIELPLLKPELFEKVGIDPPKGILLHGPPGTGKTLLAKAVASSTRSTFIEIVASELVQKFIGEGAKLVKEIFQLAKEKSPSIIFIDELDALASRRIEVGTSGEREVQRTFMQLLAEMDGFKSLSNVKVIGCTNRKDILDPAIIRPGRLDRLIEVPTPDKEGREEIFNIHTGRMTLNNETNVGKILDKMEEFSGAEIKAVCTEAGYFAIREERVEVCTNDFLKAVEKVKQQEEEAKYLEMFG